MEQEGGAAVVFSFLKVPPALTPWAPLLSQPVAAATSSFPSSPLHLPGLTPALHPVCIFPGLISFFPLSRLLPAVSANFPQLQPLPPDHRPETAWAGGKTLLLLPSRGWNWDGESVPLVCPLPPLCQTGWDRSLLERMVLGFGSFSLLHQLWAAGT